MFAIFKHKSFNPKVAEFKLVCKVRGGEGYQLAQVFYSSPSLTVTVLDCHLPQNKDRTSNYIKIQ